MAYRLDGKMVIGISSRALFDLSRENDIFEKSGVEAYCNYQVEHEKDILKPGPGFELVKRLLDLNKLKNDENLVEVIIMSRNSPDTSLRVFNAINYYGLDITRAVLVSGASLAPYLNAFKVDLFLSAYEDDVQSAIDSGIAAGIICTENIANNETTYQNRLDYTLLDSRSISDENNVIFTEFFSRKNSPINEPGAIRIAFDGDAVIFTDESEMIYKEKGLLAFEENEKQKALSPLEEGPFARFLIKLSNLQKKIGIENCPIRTALVTSRSAPAHERVIRTLRSWNVRMDEAFFLGGVEKKDVLAAFGAQIFFDDQLVHTSSASEAVPSARVPYKTKRKEEYKIC